MHIEDHHHRILIKVQVQGYHPHQWAPLQVHVTGELQIEQILLWVRLPLVYIFVVMFYSRMPFLSPTQTLLAVQELHLYPADLGCVLLHWHHELVVLFGWTTATAPGDQSVDSHCEATVTQVDSCHFLVLCKERSRKNS